MQTTEKNMKNPCPEDQASSGNILSKDNMSIISVGSGSHSTDWNSKLWTNQRHYSQTTPLMVTTGESMRFIHEMGLERSLLRWRCFVGQVQLCGQFQRYGRRHNLTKYPFSVEQKVKISFGEEKNAHDKSHNYCCKESRRIAVNGMVANNIIALRTTWILKSEYYLVLNLAAFYCPIILVCHLLHIKETVVCKIM